MNEIIDIPTVELFKVHNDGKIEKIIVNEAEKEQYFEAGYSLGIIDNGDNGDNEKPSELSVKKRGRPKTV